MGFGNDRMRVVRVMNNKPCIATIGGKRNRYDSESECLWFCYLEMLKRSGYIQDWERKVPVFNFRPFGYYNNPRKYTPDGLIIENDGTKIYQEYKGNPETYDISRIKRAFKHYDAVFDVIVNTRKKKPEIIAKMETAGCCIRRVIETKEAYRGCGTSFLWSLCTELEYIN